MATSFNIETEDGIFWYCEKRGQGPNLILIPSGEGDCSSFAKVATELSDSFTVTTFDMPGMSRSTCPPSALEDITPFKLAKQIIGLMDKLNVATATIYGCSSGGCAALALLANHSERVTSVMVHETPLNRSPQLEKLCALPDDKIVSICRNIFSNVFNEDTAAWEALGPEFHSRLEKNYVTWVRKYVAWTPLEVEKEELTRKPLFWTVGGLTPMGNFFGNVVTATNAGVEISLLPCKHFPQVSIPEKFVEHVKSCVGKAGV
jgi:pimeloyl-ACP methyl ester carboxylesterase